MGECICSSCKNLKAEIDGDEGLSEFTCKYGFPSPKCENCMEDECNETCSNYEEEDEDVTVTVKCCRCGKELTQSTGNGEDGEVFCIDCYLKRG